jgi:hypothetical protein
MKSLLNIVFLCPTFIGGKVRHSTVRLVPNILGKYDGLVRVEEVEVTLTLDDNLEFVENTRHTGRFNSVLPSELIIGEEQISQEMVYQIMSPPEPVRQFPAYDKPHLTLVA